MLSKGISKKFKKAIKCIMVLALAFSTLNLVYAEDDASYVFQVEGSLVQYESETEKQVKVTMSIQKMNEELEQSSIELTLPEDITCLSSDEFTINDNKVLWENLSLPLNETVFYTYDLIVPNDKIDEELLWTIDNEQVHSSSIKDLLSEEDQAKLTTPLNEETKENTPKKAKGVDVTTTRTFEDDGGQYNLGYIFKNYNVFVDGDYTNGQHIVGSIAVGGNVTKATGIGGSSTGEIAYRNQAPNYIKGATNIKEIMIRSDNDDFPTYFGTINATEGIKVTNQITNNATPYYFTDNYIDFTKAMERISAETASYATGGITISNDDIMTVFNSSWYPEVIIEKDGYKIQKADANGVKITLEAGKKYQIDDLSHVSILNYVGDVTGTDTIIYSLATTVELPTAIYVNDSTLGSVESGGDFSNSFLFPNATTVNGVGFTGHISAPKATVTLTGGFFNGCVIAHSMGGNAEGHMWPYNGEVFNPTSAELQATKKVDNNTPTNSQIFSFLLEQFDNGGWVNVETVNNNKGNIAFSKINYKNTGTYWYKISEVGDVQGYSKDGSQYVIKIVVTEDNNQLNKGVTYYKVTDTNNLIKDNQINNDVLTTIEKANLVFNNTTNQGNLTVKKTFGENTPLTDNEKAGIEFTVTGPDGYSRTFTYADMENGSIELSGIPTGTYTVTESKAGKTGYTLVTTYKVGDTESNKAEASVAKNADTTIELINTYTRDTGKLVVKKTFGENTPLSDAEKAGIEFIVTGPDGFNKTFTYGDMTNGVKEFTDVPTGTYTVTESNAGKTGYTLVTTYKVGGADSQEAKAAVEKDESATIELINTYTRDTGKLVVKKTFGENTPLSDNEKAGIQFTVTGPDGYSRTFTYADMENGSIELTGIPTGTYTVTESKAGKTGYTLVTTYKVGGADSQEAKAAVEKDESATIELINTYTRDTGSLTVKKELGEGNEYDNQDKEYEFTVQDGNGRYYGFDENGGQITNDNELVIKLKAEETKTLSNLPTGEYTVAENRDSANVDTYTLTVTGEGNATVKKGETASITITNVYTKDTGDLVITKTSMGTTTPKDAVFTITGPNDYSEDINYSDFTDGKYVLKGLPVGEYKVVESNANIKGYTLTVAGNRSTAIIAKDEVSQISIVNNYVSDKKASLIIYKVDQDGKFLEGANFQMEREDGEIINAIKDRARFEFKDLIDGTYTVKETTTPEGYEGIGEFEIVIENGKITCPEYGITDPFVTLSVENTNDGTTPEVIGDEYDDDDFYPEVQGDEKVETSDNTNIAGFAGLSLLSAMMFFFLRKKKYL